MISEQSAIPYKYSETRIYLIDSELEFCGYLEHVAGKRIWRFNNTLEMLALHEKLFDEIGYPQNSCKLRKLHDGIRLYKKPAASYTAETAILPAETDPSFVINVMYRQNASWQGTVQAVSYGTKKHFRSTLELLRMIDSVVSKVDRWA
jgi:hypothetical protein